jgi:uncharacterized protein YdhG (YjbR/CyaY superfamily)
MKGGAGGVEAYLAHLPPDRRAALEAVREVILENLPEGYEEAMNWGMIAYEVPLAANPKTYNGKPLMYAALASQKKHMAVYLCGLYCVTGALEAFKRDWRAKKLDMGAACVRFKTLGDLDLGAVGRAIAATAMKDFIEASKR